MKIITSICFILLEFKKPIALLLAATLIFSQSATAQTLKIDGGLIEGELLESASGLRVYRGIPYAKPPVGDLRWRAPEAVMPWQDVKTTTTFSAACPQPDTLAKMMGEQLPKMNEDCLYLNIWTQAKSAQDKKPVMVWIHGGGLNLGWGHQRGYDGSNLAKKDVILVSINYRLGPLGYLAHPSLNKESEKGVSGNYGALDQIAALQWVQRNIAQFGGDPVNVTIFGESAGATSVNALAASPLTTGLFQRAIAQSPWVTNTNFAKMKEKQRWVESAENLGLQWSKNALAKGVENNAANLRKLSAEEIVVKMGANYPVAITVDGWFMPDSSSAIFSRGEQQNVDMMVGTNKDEGTIFLGFLPFKTPDEFSNGLKMLYGEYAGSVSQLYPVSNAREVFQAKNQLITDTWFIQGALAMLDGADKVSSDSYQYVFTRKSMAMPMMGAHHGAEIGYAFNTLGPKQGGEIDQKLAAAMIDYWVQFAKAGNPNGNGRPQWPAYTGNSASYLELGDEIKVGHKYRQMEIATLNKIPR